MLDDDKAKYIFDPNNPNQCKSYNLLLKLAKKKSKTFLSSDVVQYFFQDDVFGEDFKNDIWDIPDYYDNLSVIDKIALYKKILSEDDFKEYIEKFDFSKLNINKINKYSFFDIFMDINMDINISNAFMYTNKELLPSYIQKKCLHFDTNVNVYRNIARIIS